MAAAVLLALVQDPLDDPATAAARLQPAPGIRVNVFAAEPDALVLIRADGREKRLAKSEIAARKAGLSAMPDDLVKSLTTRDLRDLVAFLKSLR